MFIEALVGEFRDLDSKHFGPKIRRYMSNFGVGRRIGGRRRIGVWGITSFRDRRKGYTSLWMSCIGTLGCQLFCHPQKKHT